MADHRSHQTQEQSIKARKHQIFDDFAPTISGPRKSFRDHLRDTPAAPLSSTTRMMLWAAGAIVAILLVVGVAKALGRHNAPRPVSTAPAPARR